MVTRVMVVGCGSIGARHARNLKSLGCEIVLCDTNPERLKLLSNELGAAEAYTSFELAIERGQCKAGIVATPSNFHITPAKAMLAAGIHVMMEKPLSSELVGLKEFAQAVQQSGCVFMMAHTYRFRAEWKLLQEILSTEPLGKIQTVEFSGGWFLPDWHIDQDYRTEYAAQKVQGGGVLLTSLSHFFDVVIWLFGEVEAVNGIKMKSSNLEIDVDDVVMCQLKTNRSIAVSIYEDFLARIPRRAVRVNAEFGYLEADFNRKNLSVWDVRKKRYLPSDDIPYSVKAPFRILEDGAAYDLELQNTPLRYSGNDAYRDEVSHFLDLVAEKKVEHALDVHAGIRIVELLSSTNIVDWTGSGVN